MPRELTEEEKELLNKEKEFTYYCLLDALSTKPYVEALIEVNDVFERHLPVCCRKAEVFFYEPVISCTLEYLTNVVKSLPEDEEDERRKRINQAIAICFFMWFFSQEIFFDLFNYFLAPFLFKRDSGITKEQKAKNLRARLCEISLEDDKISKDLCSFVFFLRCFTVKVSNGRICIGYDCSLAESKIENMETTSEEERREKPVYHYQNRRRIRQRIHRAQQREKKTRHEERLKGRLETLQGIREVLMSKGDGKMIREIDNNDIRRVQTQKSFFSV